MHGCERKCWSTVNFAIPARACSQFYRRYWQRGGQNYFAIAIHTDADSYFFMNRLVNAASLFIASLLVLTGCAAEDDPFPVHSAAPTDADAQVAGAATPVPGISNAGWKW